MKKIILLSMTMFMTGFSLEPADFLGAWELGALPDGNSEFAFKPGFEGEKVSLASRQDNSELEVVEGPGTDNQAVSSVPGNSFLKIVHQNPGDTLLAYTLAFEFKIPAPLKGGGTLFRLGNTYSEGLSISQTGKLGDYTFLYDNSEDGAIVADRWTQVVISIKIGDSFTDPTSSFDVYINGVLAHAFNPSYYQDVSGGKYYPYHLNEELFIDMPMVSRVALINRTITAEEAAELQGDLFNTVAVRQGESNDIGGKLNFISNGDGLEVYSGYGNSNLLDMYSLNGVLVETLKMENGYVSIGSGNFTPGIYLFKTPGNKAHRFYLK